MNEPTFVDLCLGKKMSKKTTSKDGGVTHPIESKRKHPAIGFPGYAMGDGGRAGGPDNGDGDASDAGPVGAPAGDGLGGGGSACEAIDAKTFGACLEAIEHEYPESSVAKQLNALFKQMMANNYEEVSSDEDVHELPQGCTTETEELISAAAAACESALTVFKRLTGFDYCQFRRK